MKSIKVFCPASVANLSCGFDVLGLCLEGVGDEMIIHKTDVPGIRITKITGADLPYEPERNVAGVAAMAMLSQWPTDFGFDVEIHKKIPAGSGIGSSAASAAGAVYGINELLGKPFEAEDLVYFAMQGEFVASKSIHADNVAPALLGGIILVRGYDPLDLIRIESPDELYLAVINPNVIVCTADARAVLPKEIPLKKAVRQWGNVGGLIAGLYTSDYGLIGRSLQDVIIEPYRAELIPGFHDAKHAAIQAGALGSGISGSGPSTFAVCKGVETANKAAVAMKSVYDKLGINAGIYVSKVNSKGVQVL